MKNLLKRIEITLFTVLICVFCFAFTACEESDISHEFENYYSQSHTNGIFELPSKMNAQFLLLENENNFVLATFAYSTNNNNDTLYKWITCSIEAKKSDMKFLGDKVVEFGKSQNWHNDYKLYIKFHYEDIDICVNYNYETNEIYIPLCDGTVQHIYQKWNVYTENEVTQLDGGADWLVEYGLGEYKNGEYKSKNLLNSMSVSIQDGNIKLYNENLSVKK